MAFNAANFAHADDGINAGNIGAGAGHNDRNSGPRIRRTTDNLGQTAGQFDLTHPQFVGIRVLHGTDHATHCKITQLGGRIFHPLNL